MKCGFAVRFSSHEVARERSPAGMGSGLAASARCHRHVVYAVNFGGTSKSIEALRGASRGSQQLRRFSCNGSAAMAADLPSLASSSGSGVQRHASGSVRSSRRTVPGGHFIVQVKVGIKALPNTSLKRSANGRPPAPGRWYAVHFHRPGAGGLPLSPA